MVQAPTTSIERTSHFVRLADGRRLCFAEYGAPDGTPVFYLHGTPGSRLQGAHAHDAALARHIRLICPDRPGYGGSSFRRLSLVEYVDDVVALADALSIDRFALFGVSGGGPFAAACALSIAGRLTAVALVSSVGPLDEPDAIELLGRSDRSLIKLIRRAPWATPPLFGAISFLMRHAYDRVSASAQKSMPAPDRAVLGDAETASMFKPMMREAVRCGGRGFAWDETLFARPWGFRVEDIRMQVLLWQGEQDATVMPEMGRRLAAAIPDCRATFRPDDGHLLVAARIGEILNALTVASKASA